MELKQKIYTTSEVAVHLGKTHGRISQIARQLNLGEIVGNTRIFTQDDVGRIRSIPDGRRKPGENS